MLTTMDAADVRYEDDGHRYYLGEQELTSVTRAMSEGGLSDERIASFYTPEGAQAGTDLQAALVLYFLHGVLPQVSPEIRPFFKQVLEFVTDGGFIVDTAEEIIVDPLLRYAGRYDFVGLLRTFGEGADLIDVKKGSVPRTVGAQTMAYRRRLPQPRVRRWALHVTAERYRLVPLNVDAQGRIDRAKDREDEADFLAALRVAQFRRRHNG